jgi:hypothetical protein
VFINPEQYILIYSNSNKDFDDFPAIFAASLTDVKPNYANLLADKSAPSCTQRLAANMDGVTHLSPRAIPENGDGSL